MLYISVVKENVNNINKFKKKGTHTISGAVESIVI